MSPRRHAGGAALLIAMLLAALVAAVTVGLATGQERWRATVEQRRDQVQATALAQAGIQWARQVLDEDAHQSATDNLGEPWALPLPPTPLDNGSIEGRIIDAQGLVNLNNLSGDDNTGTGERLRATALFNALGLPTTALDAIAHSIGIDNAPRAGNAEDTAYAAAVPPRMTPNQPALRFAEFANVRGLSPTAIAKLAPFATALPPPTTINLNTAPPVVLVSALPGLNGDALDAFLTDRARQPFATVADLRSRLPEGVTPPDEHTVSVASSFFLVTVVARQGQTLVRARALIRRGVADRPAVVWQVIE
jgi:general secretion pathway protein K